MDKNIRDVISNSRDRCWCYVKSLYIAWTRKLSDLDFSSIKPLYWLLLREDATIAQSPDCSNSVGNGWMISQLNTGTLHRQTERQEHGQSSTAEFTTGQSLPSLLTCHTKQTERRGKDKRGIRITVVVVNSTINAYIHAAEQEVLSWTAWMHECGGTRWKIIPQSLFLLSDLLCQLFDEKSQHRTYPEILGDRRSFLACRDLIEGRFFLDQEFLLMSSQ